MYKRQTYYTDTEHDYGRRSVPGADWTTNIYKPVWGPEVDGVWPAILHTETRLISYGPVSYTHLDVYKRQMACCAGWPSPRWCRC